MTAEMLFQDPLTLVDGCALIFTACYLGRLAFGDLLGTLFGGLAGRAFGSRDESAPATFAGSDGTSIFTTQALASGGVGIFDLTLSMKARNGMPATATALPLFAVGALISQPKRSLRRQRL
jgi:hypothetical protein